MNLFKEMPCPACMNAEEFKKARATQAAMAGKGRDLDEEGVTLAFIMGCVWTSIQLQLAASDVDEDDVNDAFIGDTFRALYCEGHAKMIEDRTAELEAMLAHVRGDRQQKGLTS
jgi:hypothetical protein